jgi:hypothetical protein
MCETARPRCAKISFESNEHLQERVEFIKGKVPSENAAHCSSVSGSKLGSMLIEMPSKLGEESNILPESSLFVHLHLQKIFVRLRDLLGLISPAEHQRVALRLIIHYFPVS